jgi:hypothetical protein
MEFDIFAFADYSGAAAVSAQKQHIFLATCKKGHLKIKTTHGYTRQTLQHAIVEMLRAATQNNKRILFGFDHNFAFPFGFTETLTDKNLHWRQFMAMVAYGRQPFNGMDSNPRSWAAKINATLIAKFGIAHGPFWGPGFTQLKKPRNIYSCLPFTERRHIEVRLPRLKSIFQLGGVGSVGMQSLYGMYHLAGIVEDCNKSNIPLHCWPFDGWQIPENGHVAIEIYPGYYNQGLKSDLNDAKNSVAYFRDRQNSGKLAESFAIPVYSAAQEEIQQEGWLAGIE